MPTLFPLHCYLNSYKFTTDAKENNLYYEQEETGGPLPVPQAGASSTETGGVAKMTRLYRSPRDVQHWFAFSDANGWVSFPAQIGGWAHRRSLGSIAGLELSEVPLRLAFNTGLLEAQRRRRYAHAA